MTNTLAAVARHQQLDAAILAAKTPKEQLAAERALRAYIQGDDGAGNFTVARGDAPPERHPNGTGNFTVPRKPA